MKNDIGDPDTRLSKMIHKIQMNVTQNVKYIWEQLSAKTVITTSQQPWENVIVCANCLHQIFLIWHAEHYLIF